MFQYRKHAVTFAPSCTDMASCPYCDPYPQPLPTTSRACPTYALKRETQAGPGFVGRGADRVCRLNSCLKNVGSKRGQQGARERLD